MEESKIAMKIEEETKGIKKMCEQLGKTVEYEFDKGIEQVDTAEMKEAIDMLKDLYAMKKDIVESCYYKQIMEAMEESEYGEDYDYEGRKGYIGQPRSQRGRFMSRGDGRRSNSGGRSRGRGRRGYEDPMMMDDDDMEDMYDMEYMRDMDRGMGKMYYSGGGGSSSGGSGGRSSGGMSGGSSSGGSGGSSGGGGSMGYSEGGRDSREGRSGQSRRGYMEAKEQGKDKGEKMKSLEEYMKSMAEDLTEAIENASPEERSMVKNKLSVLTQKM